MIITFSRRAAAAALLAVFALSGCSSAHTSSSGTPDDASPASSEASPKAAAPLTAYLESLQGAVGDQHRSTVDAKREQSLAACMKQAGFEYTPVTTSATSATTVGPSDADLDSRDWVSIYGYGLIETPQGKTVDSENDAKKATDDKVAAARKDPNYVYYHGLTTSERHAYDQAMYGKADDPNAKVNLTDDWQQMGCFGIAKHDAGERQDVMKSAAAREVDAAVTDFWNGWANWPGMPELQSAWVSCMDGKGYAGYHKQTDAETEIGAKIAQARENAGSGKDPANLSALGEQERKLALADLDCREATKFRTTYDSISAAAQTQFMQDHAQALEALKTAVEQAGNR